MAKKNNNQRNSNSKDYKSCKGKGGNSNYTRDPKRSQDKRGSDPTLDPKSNVTNDVVWYSLTDQILKAAASYPFSAPIGQSLFKGTDTGVPGIMVLHLTPSIGNSVNAASAVNIAAQKFYSFIRQANSGSKNYEAADLMMYFLGVGAVYELLAACKRVYGLARKYSNYNKYLGRALMSALGFNYDSVVANQADFRRQWNSFVAQVNQALHIPTGMHLFERSIFRNSHVFVDHPGHKFQMYVYKQDYYYKFSGTAETTGSSLTAVAGPNTNMDYKEVFTIIQNMISELIADEDIQIMSGDILKAYGDTNCFKVQQLEEDFETTIAYDVPVLAQIHNVQNNHSSGITVAWKKSNGTQSSLPNVYQNSSGVIISEQVANQSTTAISTVDNSLVLDIPVEDPTPGDVMESTRLMSFYDETDLHYHSGSEICNSIEIYTMQNSNPTQFLTTNIKGSLVPCIGQGSSDKDGAFTEIYELAPFDWAPLRFLGTNSQGSFSKYGATGDISNYTVLQSENIKNLHDAALLGLFDVPTLTVSR